MLKSTYGTGCFALLNTGRDAGRSTKRLLTTIAYRLDGKSAYAIEGSIFVAGAAIQWLRDGLHLIARADESGPLAAAADPEQSGLSGARLYRAGRALVGCACAWRHCSASPATRAPRRSPAPRWKRSATRPSICWTPCAPIGRARRDTVLRVDGGMVASDWMLQRLADILDAPVDRPVVLETTALGAAWLAGSGARVWPAAKAFAKAGAEKSASRPAMDRDMRAAGGRLA